MIPENIIPYWLPGADYSDTPFFIRKMDTMGYVKAPEIPAASIPMTGFLFLKAGELLAEAGGETFLCYPGQLLLIPSGCMFSIKHYRDCIGFCGGFSAAILPDASSLIGLNNVVHKAFWFDDAAFIAELFNMLEAAFDRKDEKFIGKGLDMLLFLTRASDKKSTHPLVSRFMELLFDDNVPIRSGAEYAAECNRSLNWLNRTVKKGTGRSITAWIDQARLTRAKSLLEHTELPMTEIATAVGLDDQSYFARFFRKQSGMTPSEFRKLHR